MSIFDYSEVPETKGARWFVRRGVTTKFNRGFKSKAEASAWIDGMGKRLDWRVGYLFQLRGDTGPMCIVGRTGNRPDAVRPSSPLQRTKEIA